MEQALFQNAKFFKTWYIVTLVNDTETIKICRYYNNINLIFFPFKDKFCVFNKGGAIRQAQTIVHNLYPNHFKLILDSDIILPNDFTNVLNSLILDKDRLYYCKRLCDGEQIYQDFVAEPMGFFQLYFSNKYMYNNSYGANLCDMIFTRKFNGNFGLLPFFVKHLGKTGIHWGGK